MEKLFTKVVRRISGVTNIPSFHLDLANSNHIYSSDLGRLRWKSDRTNPEHKYEQIVNVPNNFYHLHSFVMLDADVMFVNSAPLLVTMYQRIDFGEQNMCRTNRPRQQVAA